MPFKGAAHDVDQLRASADRLVVSAVALSRAAAQVLAKGDSAYGTRSKLALAIESVRLHAYNVIKACDLRAECEEARRFLRTGTSPAIELMERYLREAADDPDEPEGSADDE